MLTYVDAIFHKVLSHTHTRKSYGEMMSTRQHTRRTSTHSTQAFSPSVPQEVPKVFGFGNLSD
jgi:hypothetical protein